ncbi:MAG: hypothetical protein J5716_02590 [Alphaproteobacteria bacterium]|nr:hypothetical protein [Alphaproteobacteria bacterium]
MGVLNGAFGRTLEGRIRSLANGDFQGAFRTKQTVFVEDHPDKPGEHILRFGSGKDDYFPVSGSAEDEEFLCEVLSKVIESPTQLKKIKNMPVEQRPRLGVNHENSDCYGCCNGEHILISNVIGTGYRAAATFVHEFQHQYQETHDGLEHYKGSLSLTEDILDDRLCEAAAETAAYQYLYEMKDANPQARNVFLCESETGGYAQGLREYAAAKDAGLDEGQCILAGMHGYAASYGVARSYERCYHKETLRDPRPNLKRYADYLHDGLKEQAAERVDSYLSSEQLDETAAFKSYTVGMMETLPSDEQIREAVRSPEYSYVTTSTAEFLKDCVDCYQELTGRPHSKQNEDFAVRDEGGVRRSTEPEIGKSAKRRGRHRVSIRRAIYDSRETLQELKIKGKKKINKLKDALRRSFKEHNEDQEPLEPRPYVFQQKDDRNTLLSLDGRKKNLDNFTGALFYKPSIAYESIYDIPDAEWKKVGQRDCLLERTLSIVLKDEQLRKQLLTHGSENPLTVGFSEEKKFSPDTPAIVLDPRKSPEELAQDFRKQYEALRQKEDPTRQATPLQKGETEKQKTSALQQITGIYRKQQKNNAAAQTAAVQKKKQYD